MAHARSVAVTRRPHRGPSRLLIALATLWMVLSLAIGSGLTVEPARTNEEPQAITGTVER